MIAPTGTFLTNYPTPEPKGSGVAFYSVCTYNHRYFVGNGPRAQAIILGCTELSLVKRDYPIGAGYLDAMEVLAQTCVLRCGGQLKEEYQDLISK